MLTWGPWTYKPDSQVLVHKDSDYEVAIGECFNSGRTLDWIIQVVGKNWADDATLAGLVRAIDDLLLPQEHLCGSGLESSLTAKELGSLLDRRAKDLPAEREREAALEELMRAREGGLVSADEMLSVSPEELRRRAAEERRKGQTS